MDYLRPTFRYEPLINPTADIRVVSIEPGPRSSPITCRIEHVSLDDDPTYSALSYTWGERSDRETVSIDGYDHLVTRNLYNALKALRDETATRTLWVDAICINQQDAFEQSKQVQVMRRIFASAQRVYAWTGEHDNCSGVALAIFSDLSALFEEVLLLDEDLLPPILSYFTGPRDWQSLRRFLQREYWNRVWVLQEIYVPDRLDLLCHGPETVFLGSGDSWVPMSWIYKAVKLMEIFTANVSQATIRKDGNAFAVTMFRNLAGETPGGLVMGQTVITLKNAGENLQPLTFARLLRMTMNLHATDPRDKIYALLGLMPGIEHTIQPDYTLDFETVCRVMFERVAAQTGNLDVLSGERPLAEEVKPSWLPDMRSAYPGADGQGWAVWSTPWRASGSSVPRLSFTPDNKLNISGFRISKAEVVIGPFDSLEVLPQDQIETSSRKLAGTLASIRAFWEGLTKEIEREILWRLLIIDHYGAGVSGLANPAPPEVRREFEALMEFQSAWDDVAKGTMDIDTAQSKAEELSPIYWTYMMSLNRALRHRCIFLTENLSYMGVGPCSLRPDDEIVLLCGGKFFYALREIENHEYIYLGDACIQGAMEGQCMPDGDLDMESRTSTFTIV